MTAPQEINDRRAAYEDDADNTRSGSYDDAIRSFVGTVQSLAKTEKEHDQLRTANARARAVCERALAHRYDLDPQEVLDALDGNS